MRDNQKELNEAGLVDIKNMEMVRKWIENKAFHRLVMMKSYNCKAYSTG